MPLQFNSNLSNQSDGALSDWQDEIVKQMSPSLKDEKDYHWTQDPEVSKAKRAIASLRSTTDMPTNLPSKCPVAHHKPKPSHHELEQDFTTQGKPSDLSCPFAKAVQRNGNKDHPSIRLDPIAVEFHQDATSGLSLAETNAACNKCPIRFLDKHSPEEIAQYFENHKHEIPRSHEICIKRYQANEQSIQHLDAKYGNLVNMIQGLGNKHKEYLPDEANEELGEDDPAGLNEQASNEKIKKWAIDVDQPAPEPSLLVERAKDEQRLSHFEKPLRDVRVGESPSRPWGIPVPVESPPASHLAPSGQDLPKPVTKQVDSLDKEPVVPKVSPSSQHTATNTASSRTGSRRRGRKRPQIVFNGPVFFGYSAEQAAVFLDKIATHGPAAE